MMKKSLFITDLDGTLLDDTAAVPEQTKKIINALTQKGVCFSIATARTIMSVSNILNGLCINAPAVLMNGVCLYDMGKKEYIHCHYISEASFKRFTDIVGGAKDISPFIYTIKDNTLCAYYENMNTEPAKSFAEERRKKYGKNFVQTDFKNMDPTYAVYFTICGYRDILEPYNLQLKEDKDLYVTFYRDTYDTNVYYLEMCNANASKAGGIKYLREHYAFNDIHCFGDNTNDIPMFLESDHRYAVANAVEELKAYADEIIDSNCNNGVALKMQEVAKE